MALSSITKKLIMSISGLFLIIFMLLHTTINFFSVIDSFKGTYGTAEGWFAKGCEFMTWPIIDIMVPILALGFLVHIVYAFILTLNNIQARGGYKRYEVASKAKTETWASKNMLVLGVVVLGLVGFHLTHFWAEMQLKEMFMGIPHDQLASPYELLNITFKNWWMVVLYIIWFVALGLHLNHGFWSAFQTIGLSNKIWEKRLLYIGYVVIAIIVLCLSVTAINACLQANAII